MKSIDWRKIQFTLWRVALLALIGVTLYPVAYRLTRLLTLFLAVIVWGGALYLFRLRRRFCLIWCVAPCLLAFFLVLPGRKIEQAKLREEYVQALIKYEGSKYVWGGENKLGIDCSGLVRKGLINASFKEGFATLNPRLVRAGFNLWWYDASAEALRDEYRGQTRQLFRANSIRSIAIDKIQPGDFAVTSDGIHTLAYLGDGTWVEADPALHKVVQLKPDSDSQWLNVPVQLLRWRQLDKTENSEAQ